MFDYLNEKSQWIDYKISKWNELRWFESVLDEKWFFVALARNENGLLSTNIIVKAKKIKYCEKVNKIFYDNKPEF